MTNSVAFLCSFLLLIVLLSSTDGQWNERWNGKFPYEERRINERYERWNYGSGNNDRTNNDRMNERWNNERWNDERSRSNDESNERYSEDIYNSERSNNGRWTDERWNNNDRRNDEIRSDESQNNEKSNNERRNDERRNDERRNDESRNDDKRNDGRRNDDKRDDGRRNDDKRNDGRRNDDRRNDEKRKEERPNDESPNDEKRNDERRNDERRNDERRNDEKRNDERRNDERRNDERRNNESPGDERLFSLADKCPADKMENWTYRGNNGVLKWIEKYPECGGRSQSPIAINYYQVTFLADIEKLKFQNYKKPMERATIVNNGHTIQITPGDDVQRIIHFNGTKYRLGEVHFHWGDDESHGSEHTINFDRFALEMHLVHQSGTGRTAVVAVLFREQSQTSKELENITQNFSKLMYKDNRTEIKSPINLNNLLPANPATYFWYEGSLTTPPCTEGVQWVLLRDIMTVGTKQMAKFRKLYSTRKRDSNEHCRISNNYRPLQELNGRTVVVSQ